MLEKKEINKIKEEAQEFFGKMTIQVSGVDVSLSSEARGPKDAENTAGEEKDVVSLDIKLDEPQILIGQGGQTLFEIQRILRAVLSRKLQKFFYLDLDINDYKKKKVEYLKDLAKSSADQASLTKEEKALPPMSSYERRIVHAELAQRTDVSTESRGVGLDRRIVIKPKE
jgi:spoIIIJ-associated protein